MFSGSNAWYDAWGAITYGYLGDFFETSLTVLESYTGCEDIRVLGRIKGQSNNDALNSGGQANSLVIDSDYATVTYNATSDINMTQVLDMATNSLVTNNPFETAATLIAVDSDNYPTLDKKANIKFKNINAANPQLTKDGATCVAPDCTNVVHDTTALTLTADVTGFSTYLIYDMLPDTPVTFNAPGSQTFTVVAANQSITYAWFVDGSVQSGETANTFVYGVARDDEGSHNVSVAFTDTPGFVTYDWDVTVTGGHQATYEAEDVPKVGIDIVIEWFLAIGTFVVVLALITLAWWGVSRYNKARRGGGGLF